ncbi:hypothetical protein U14_01607 [Candidatus Moduliflexus flocculans]|uniref:DUF554 domain-containing protein n=1 Tax=Candidatus Moduliflexus flocculans TaxID=1499966 RepID=A0A0S6VX44_9BACT|nr:hypothetical protein U14_01607 [Candidatus Moduliflexus flocculans]
MIGPLINSAAVVIGGIAGTVAGPHIPERLKNVLPLCCGLISISIGTVMCNKVQALPPVALALLMGTSVGEILYLEKRLGSAIGWIQRQSKRLQAGRQAAPLPEEFLLKFVTVLVLFSVSGMGIFGSMHEGMTGDPEILVAKAVLDLVTAAIFATELGLAVTGIAIPQMLIQSMLYFSAFLLLPLITPAMKADFSACGGIIMIATGLRICGIKIFPIVNMLPALLIIMPLSALWSQFFG